MTMEVKPMDNTKPIFDDCIQISSLSINLMRNNKGKPIIVIEDDEGNLIMLEEDTYDEKKS